MIVTFGAMIAEVPHTRPPTITGSTTDGDLAAVMRLDRPSYQGPTGVIGVLHGKNGPGEAILLRTDMDALPILEETGYAFERFVEAGYDPVPGLIGANQSDLAASDRDQALILERFTTEGVDVTVSATGLPIVAG